MRSSERLGSTHMAGIDSASLVEADDELDEAGLGALAFFSTWTVIGLFIDGWAHNVDKPEDFFTPWHAVLYSGFVCGVGFFVLREIRAGRRIPPVDRLVPLGVAGFVVAGVGDGFWHSIFGVEVGVEALLSPTHLVLMTSGLALVSTPARAWTGRPAGDLRTFLPVAVSAMLSLSVVTFFLQFASTQRVYDHLIFDADQPEWVQLSGILAVLVTNAVVLGSVAWIRTRWTTTPAGTYTLMLGGCGALMSILSGFDQWLLAVPLLAAGALADGLVGRGASNRTILAAVPTLLWPLWFLVYDHEWGLGWEVELWTGTIVFGVLTGVMLEVVMGRSPEVRGE